MIWLNFKTYKQTSAEAALNLIKIIERVSQETAVSIFPTVQALDLGRISQQTKLELWLQHIDPIEPGRYNGQLSPYTAKLAGAQGVFINHSEKLLALGDIQRTIKLCQKYELKSLVFCDSPAMVNRVGQFKPNFISFENPAQVATQQAEFKEQKAIIQEAVKVCQVPFVLGAGIANANDIKQALELGAIGVVLSSAFVKAKDPYQFLLGLAQAFKS